MPSLEVLMYVRSISIRNVRSLSGLKWDLPEGQASAGWHVVIGDNGAGKSSFLRSVALALVGPTESVALRQEWNDWLRRDQPSGSITLALDWDGDRDVFTGSGRTPESGLLKFTVALKRSETGVSLTRSSSNIDPQRHAWGRGTGWFGASYGPFRRFTGGDKDQEKLYYSNPKLARHLSVFAESVALTECLDWLKQLRFRQLESKMGSEAQLLEGIIRFVNQPDFLPHGVKLRSVSSQGVEFVDANGCTVPVENLSDGYRSILSMTFELIRQMEKTFGASRLFDSDGSTVTSSGVVLVDEVDAHLHPTWQRRVGIWFRKHFPSLQFIVTTHSPLVCQAAEFGTVFRLPQPGIDEKGSFVSGTALKRLIFGDVLDAYGTGVFGDGVTRSDSSRKKLGRLAELNRKELKGQLVPGEQAEQLELRAILPTAASSVVATGANAITSVGTTTETISGGTTETNGPSVRREPEQ